MADPEELSDDPSAGNIRWEAGTHGEWLHGEGSAGNIRWEAGTHGEGCIGRDRRAISGGRQAHTVSGYIGRYIWHAELSLLFLSAENFKRNAN